MLTIHCGGGFLFTDSSYTGTLFVQTDSGCFPSEGWTDYPEIVLGWWLDTLKSVLIGREGRTYTFLFMDGPYAIRCLKESDHLTLRFERENTAVLPACKTTLDAFSAAIRNAMETLIRQLYLAAQTDRIESIRGYLKQLDAWWPDLRKKVDLQPDL
ncbi:MAG: hypothetical protein IKP40_11005 [Clostridia bacterium]|nr:hypothetical protein [Clostridia bacterium]